MQSWDVATLEFGEHKPQVLHTDADTRVIAINLPAGEELGDHETHERAYLVVAAGEVEFEGEEGKRNGGPGFVAHFEPHERRAVRARGDARVILILAPWAPENR